MQSVTEEDSFQEFLRTAELSSKEFQAEKLNIKFVNPKSQVGLLSTTERTIMKTIMEEKKDLLKIPRRPKWTKETTPEELNLMENESFLEWRRDLALLQEQDGLIMTPYERNLEFWRQLWRVVEKSDIVVQIVDARNPLLFRSEDLEKYVKEVDENKKNILLLNKADYLTEQQRIQWAEYFDKENLTVAFFSALDKPEEEIETAESENEDDSDSSDEEGAESLTKMKDKIQKIESEVKKVEEKIENFELEPKSLLEKNNPDVLSRLELIQFFKDIDVPLKKENSKVIGLIGYPNVGKSSTINALLQEKKVSVSATPGKTKHFQTLFLEKDLILCDCCGLVLPSFCATKADMVLNGILPIDQLRDHVPPVNTLCTFIPRHILEDQYGMLMAKPLEGEDPNRPPHSEELLLAHAYNRGFMTANGQPDQSRSARYILKDFVNGKLLYCHSPPDIKQEDFHTFPERSREAPTVDKLPPRQQRSMKVNSYIFCLILAYTFFLNSRLQQKPVPTTSIKFSSKPNLQHLMFKAATIS